MEHDTHTKLGSRWDNFSLLRPKNCRFNTLRGIIGAYIPVYGYKKAPAGSFKKTGGNS